MPIFDYFCTVCEKAEPRLVKNDEKEQEMCSCGSELPMSWLFPNPMGYVRGTETPVKHKSQTN